MKKTLSIFILIGLFGSYARSQTKAQVMLQQIADVQIYIKTIKTGYQQTKQGLDKVHSLKNGSFDLHNNYFNSLKQVSPAVHDNKKIPEIIKDQQQIISLFQQEIDWQKKEAILGADEIGYLQQVDNNLIAQCNTDVDELHLVTDAGTQMTDEERIKRIDKIYTATVDKYQFCQSFIHQARAFALDRRDSKTQAKIIRKLYDIN